MSPPQKGFLVLSPPLTLPLYHITLVDSLYGTYFPVESYFVAYLLIFRLLPLECKLHDNRDPVFLIPQCAPAPRTEPGA